MIPHFLIPPVEFFGVYFSSFDILFALGFVVGAVLFRRRASIVGLSPRVACDVAVLTLLFGVAGAHLFSLVLSHPEILSRDPVSLIKPGSGGFSSYGGWIGAAAAVGVYLGRKRLSLLAYSDAWMFGAAPGWTIGRLGCFTVHDHPGSLTSFPLAVRFPDGLRHDLGLYEAMLAFLITAELYYLNKKAHRFILRRGAASAIVLTLYGLGRFALDFLRAADLPDSNPRYAGLTFPQYASLAAALLGFFLAWRSIRPRPYTPS